MTRPDVPPYDTTVPCRVCGAVAGDPCKRYTDEFNHEPGSRRGDPTPWPHRFGGRC